MWTAPALTGGFQSTPSARRATAEFPVHNANREIISIHALREEGDMLAMTAFAKDAISIHALREEGDRLLPQPRPRQDYFNPRPPRGGRLPPPLLPSSPRVFQSTPSARRATWRLGAICPASGFQSTPSARRATAATESTTSQAIISIHALREEGDKLLDRQHTGIRYFNPRPPRGGRPGTSMPRSSCIRFQSTPSARRATCFRDALRKESDISIHALREEGDDLQRVVFGDGSLFQSTPSARRATGPAVRGRQSQGISIHALREEGDPSPRFARGGAQGFQSTPSARRATAL